MIDKRSLIIRGESLYEMFSKKSDKARVSAGDTAPAYSGMKRPGLYTGDCVKPSPGALPSSKASSNIHFNART